MGGDTIRRRRFLGTVGAGTAVALAGCTSQLTGGGGSSFPSEDIKLVVPYSTGGGFDTYARTSKPYWEEYLPDGSTVVVRNVTGAGGRTGASRVYNQDGNPHWLLFWYPAAAIPPQLVLDTNYDVFEMSNIGAFLRAPNGLVVTESAGVETWDDLLAKVSDLKFATQGRGSSGHVGVVMLSAVTGEFDLDDVSFVHYEGTGTAKSGLARGEANAFITGSASSALDVAKSVDGATLFTVFSTPEVGEFYADEAKYFSSEVDGVSDLDRFANLASLLRYFAGPPDVSEGPLSTLREAHMNVVNDEDFRQESRDKGRPVPNPGDHTVVQEIMEGRREVYSQPALKQVFEDSYG